MAIKNNYPYKIQAYTRRIKRHYIFCVSKNYVKLLKYIKIGKKKFLFVKIK